MVVVIGPPHEDVTRVEAERLGLATAVNPEPGRGMASSVAVGFAYARRQFASHPSALLWPVDHAHVDAATVRAVLAQLTPASIVVPTYRDRGGHPTGFGRDLWQDLESCLSAPQGARSVIRQLARTRPEHVERLPVTDAGVIADVDVRAQLDGRRRG